MRGCNQTENLLFIAPYNNGTAEKINILFARKMCVVVATTHVIVRWESYLMLFLFHKYLIHVSAAGIKCSWQVIGLAVYHLLWRQI